VLNIQASKMISQLPRYGSVASLSDSSIRDRRNDDDSPFRTYTPLFVGFLVMSMIGVVILVSPNIMDKNVSPFSLASIDHEYQSSHHRHHKHDHDPDVALFYDKQIVDHFSRDGEGLKSYWKHRYYKSMKYFGGPGSPIFLIVGGEGALDNGMLYPFVSDILAKKFNAAVVQVEHRFYGRSKPVENATVPELLQLLTPQQAMADMLRLVNVYLRESDFQGCSLDRMSRKYCPIITVGGSYPGFLSAMFRFLHPDVIDAAYASAAPLYMYAQRTDPNVFYDIVTSAAERASPGCPAAVKSTLLDVMDTILGAASVLEAVALVGACEDSIPDHIKTPKDLSDALIQMTSYTFANDNSGCYPPGPQTDLFKNCQVFQNPNIDSLGKMRIFFDRVLIEDLEANKGCEDATVRCDEAEELQIIRKSHGNRTCFDLAAQFPDSPDSEVVGGVLNSYDEGTMWEFQTCTTIIFLAGFSNHSMFPAHNASYEDLTKECLESFGITPRPRELADMWGFDDLVARGASRILFTNGAQDMWAGGSILTNLTDTLLALNFENGAHHSDLSHQGPTESDTPDIMAGYEQISEILANWLEEIMAGS
jgi:pimeloyl-ACP methyl ester carboxylesterase